MSRLRGRRSFWARFLRLSAAGPAGVILEPSAVRGRGATRKASEGVPMKFRIFARLLWCVPAVMLTLPASPARVFAQEGERLSDKDVKQVLADLDHARDRFEDALDGKVKSSVIRGPSGETSVSRYLQDLQDNVKKLNERFTPQYSASKEAETVLRQGTEINTYIKAQPAEMKGGSEWDTMARSLSRLAHAYHTTFPLPPDAPVRRMNDAEAAGVAEEVAKQGDQFKKQIDQEKAIPKPARDAAKKDVDAVIKQAKTLKSRLSDGQPSTAEARTLMDLTSKVGTFVGAQSTLLPGTTGAWKALQAPLDKLSQAFAMK